MGAVAAAVVGVLVAAVLSVIQGCHEKKKCHEKAAIQKRSYKIATKQRPSKSSHTKLPYKSGHTKLPPKNLSPNLSHQKAVTKNLPHKFLSPYKATIKQLPLKSCHQSSHTKLPPRAVIQSCHHRSQIKLLLENSHQRAPTRELPSECFH